MLLIALVAGGLVAAPTSAVVNPVDASQNVVCAAMADTEEAPVAVACGDGRVQHAETTCTGSGDDYQCTVTYETRLSLAGVSGFEGYWARIVVEDSEDNHVDWSAAGGGVGPVTSWSMATVTYADIGAEGRDVVVRATVCVGKGIHIGDGVLECGTWSPLTVHLPAEGGGAS